MSDAPAMFDTTVAGSLPKPAWLAEPNRLWAPWRLTGAERHWPVRGSAKRPGRWV
jgi:methionine synthase II (cobalamin-independent)